MFPIVHWSTLHPRPMLTVGAEYDHLPERARDYLRRKFAECATDPLPGPSVTLAPHTPHEPVPVPTPRDTVTMQPGPGAWVQLDVWDDSGRMAMMVVIDPMYLTDELPGRMLALVRGVRATRFALPRLTPGPRLVP